MDRNGYIGRAPADSSVIVARQVFSPSGVTTDFTFTSGYTPGYLDLYLNGSRLVEGTDYTATDTSTISVLNGGADGGDVIEAVAYKAFNLGDASRIGIQSAGVLVGNVNTLNFVGTGNSVLLNGNTVDVQITGGSGGGGGGGVASTITVADESSDTTCFPVFVTAATGDLNPKSGSNLTFNSSNGTLTATTFGGNLTGNVTGDVTGTATTATLANTATVATNAQGLTGTPNISVGTISASGSVSIAGTLTYEDVTNIDSVGIITARSAIVLSENNAIHYKGTSGDDLDAILRESSSNTLLINSRNSARINIDSNNDGTGATFKVGTNGATGSTTDLITILEDGKVRVPDNGKFVAGAGDDLQIYHDGSNSYIDDAGTGALYVRGSYLAFAGINGEQLINAEQNAAVEIFYDNSKKLETTADGVSVSGAVAGFDYLQAPFSSTVNFTVTVASKTSAHRYNGTGSSNAYLIDGVQAPFLTLTPGRTYRFTLSSSDMSSHPFRFYLEADKTTAYTTNVTSTSTYTEIVVTDSTPQVLHYQCSSHGYMGNAVNTNSNVAATQSSGISTEAATVTNGQTTLLDLGSAQDHKLTCTGTVTISCTGGTQGESHTVRVINSGITTVGFSTYFLFPSGSVPSFPTASGAISLISFTVNRVGAAGTQLLAGASLNFS